jgi:hypothetical protein
MGYNITLWFEFGNLKFVACQDNRFRKHLTIQKNDADGSCAEEEEEKLEFLEKYGS